MSLDETKIDVLQETVEQYKADVVCLTETWITKEKQQHTNLSEYTGHFSNRAGRIGGGVCIFTKNSLHATKLTSHTTSTLSVMSVLISYENAPPIIIMCVCHPPRAQEAKTLEYLESTATKLTQKHSNAHLVLTGDFNRLPLEAVSRQFNLNEKVKFPTRGNATLDRIITDIDDYENAIELPPLTSKNDHCGILLRGTSHKVTKYKTVSKRSINTTTRQKIEMDIATENWSNVLQAENIDEKVNQLHIIVEKVLDTNCPVKNVKVRKTPTPWITDAIRKTIRARDKAYKKGGISYKFLCKLVTNMIRTQKRQYVKNNLNDCISSKTWWKNVNILEKQPEKVQKTKHFIEGQWMDSDQMAHRLDDYFISVGGSEIHPPPSIPVSGPGISPLSLGEVKKMFLKKLDVTKATSSEDYPTWISRDLREEMCILVHNIVNNILKTGYYPHKWKVAQIHPLNKVPSPKKFERLPANLSLVSSWKTGGGHYLGTTKESNIKKHP